MKLWQRKKILIVLAICASLGLVISGDSSASAATDSRWGNAVERAYYNYGYDAGVWLSSPGRGYRDATVDVPYGQNWVDVQIRGSWYNHSNAYVETRACNTYSNDWRLQSISSNCFSRGSYSGYSGVFIWNPSGYKTARMNVSGICDGRLGQTVSHSISLTNTFEYRRRPNGGWNVGYPSVDTMWVSINCQNAPWRVEGKSWVTNAYNPADTNNYGSAWQIAPNPLRNAKPGDTIDWWHSLYVRNANMTESVENGVQQDVFNIDSNQPFSGGAHLNTGGAWHTLESRWQSAITDDWRARAWHRQYNARPYNSNWLETIVGKPNLEEVKGEVGRDKFMYTRIIRQEDVGKRICQRVYWKKEHSTADPNRYAYSPYACVEVPYQYNLVPSVSVNSRSVDEAATLIEGISGSVTNNGSTQSDKNTKKYAVARYVIRASSYSGTPSAGDGINQTVVNNGQDVCKVVDGMAAGKFTASDCKEMRLSSDNEEFAVNYSKSIVNGINDDVSGVNLKHGDKVCYVTIVSSYNRGVGENTFRYSNSDCASVNRKPKVQVWGGDIKTNDQVITGITKSHRGNNLIPGVSDDNTIHNSQQHWLFGKCAHLDFGSFGTPDPIARKISRCMQGNEGSTVASDKNGSVQFFTDGLQVYYSDGSVMDNGQGIGSTSTTTQAAASFPIEGNKYVVVTSSAASENGKTGDLRYSIVDMSRTGSGGKKGVVTIKNQSFGPQGANHKVGEALAVSVNAARDGYWVIAHLPGTTTMRAFSVPYKWNGSNGGALTPTDSTVGIVVAGTRAGNQAPGFGTINFNNSNSKAVIATSGYTMNANSVIKIMNFNNSTTGSDAGKFSLIKEWQVDKSSDTFVYSADFSPKEDYVYVTSLYNNVENGYLSRYRYDVSGAPNKEVVVGKNSSPAQAFPKCTLDGNRRSGGQVRRAPNGKMYVANRGCQTIGVIANPDATNIANIGWRPSGQGLAGATSVYGLPQAAAVNVADIPFTVIANYAYYGSWGEYGITAKDKIESASGAGLSSSFDGRSVDGGAQSYNRLTFANNAASAFGNFTTNPVIGSYSTPSIKPKNSNRLSGLVDISGLNGEYETSGTLQLTGGTLAAGRNVVIRSRGAVKVSGDLLYGAISKASQVPQLVIYARSIIIERGVKEVNAWLITPNDGYVSTCGDVVGPDRWLTNLSVSDCNKNQLKINGPIMAGHLYLRRTYGGQHDSPAQNNHSMHPGTPAEILNLRADAYMWGYNYSKNSGAIRTVNLKELPPRY